MKVIINIGGASYLATTAAAAAKIADLLGNMTAIRFVWAADRTGRETYYNVSSEGDMDTRVSTESVGDRRVFASAGELNAWVVAEQQFKAAAALLEEGAQ